MNSISYSSNSSPHNTVIALTQTFQQVSLSSQQASIPQDVMGLIGSYLYRNEFENVSDALLEVLNSEPDGKQKVQDARNRYLHLFSSISPLMSSEMGALFGKCQSIIQSANQQKAANAPAALILQSVYDPTDSLTDPRLILQLELLVKTDYVVFQMIGDQNVSLNQAIAESAKQVGSRAIMILLVRTHGAEESFRLGLDNYYRINDIRAADFACLDVQATILLNTCLAGVHLAKKIASLQPRPVFATATTLLTSSLMFCCSRHGYGMVGFDLNNTMNVKRFQKHNDSVTEVIPCAATKEKIEQIRIMLLDQLIQFANLENAYAQHSLSIFYERGLGVPRSFEKALLWGEKAARQGHMNAQYNLGLAYYYGKRALRSFEKAVFWFEKAARQGHKHAQYRLGAAYYEGKGVAQSFEKAVFWLEKAARQGNMDAQYHLGVTYYKGEGVIQSFENAVLWFEKAARQGHIKAQFDLGAAYYKGEGVIQSFENAVLWFRKAALQGDMNAQYCLGVNYYNGKGVTHSFEQAILWFKKAALQGHALAREQELRLKASSSGLNACVIQ